MEIKKEDRSFVAVFESIAHVLCSGRELYVPFTCKRGRSCTKEVSMRFENHVALVTGAASGIGRALVRQ